MECSRDSSSSKGGGYKLPLPQASSSEPAGLIANRLDKIGMLGFSCAESWKIEKWQYGKLLIGFILHPVCHVYVNSFFKLCSLHMASMAQAKKEASWMLPHWHSADVVSVVNRKFNFSLSLPAMLAFPIVCLFDLHGLLFPFWSLKLLIIGQSA